MNSTIKNAPTYGVKKVEVAENFDYNRIYESKDLSFAIPARENREICQAHVRSICKKMDEDMLGIFIVDDETGYLLDGNHRWIACEKYMQEGGRFSKPFRYIYGTRLPNETVAEAIVRYNKNRKSWTAQDFICLKKNEGDKYANELFDFCNERKWLHKETKDKKTGVKTIEPIMRYGGWFIKGINCSPLFKRGDYYHTQEELDAAKDVYNEIEKIMDAAKITKTGTWFGEFVAAWRRVRIEQKDKIASLPNGFESLIPEFEKRYYVREETLMNQVAPNMRNLESVIDDAVEAVA